jgi:hypothetical protein
MNKKTIILTERQLNEIGAYLTDLGTMPDMVSNSNEVTPQGANGDGESYAKPVRGADDIADDMTPENGWPVGPKSFGKGPAHIYEMKKKDWESKYIINERNLRLDNLNFNGKTYDAANMRKSRIKKAIGMAQSDNPIEVEKGNKSLHTMMKNDAMNGKDFGESEQLLTTAEKADSSIQANKPEGTKIQRKTNIGPVGKTHDKNIEKGIITLPKNNN